MQAITPDGIFEHAHALDNSGTSDVSGALQAILDGYHARGVRSLTLRFLPGVYRIDAPITFSFISIKLEGEAHGGVDVHGMNLPSGTTFLLGEHCAPHCFAFGCCGNTVSFPAGESDWPYKTTRVALAHLNFVGYNNTDVDTRIGYSRFRGDAPNFRGLRWYPQAGRYQDATQQGQRAITILPNGAGEKAEMLSVDSCYFTDLYVGLEVANCDVSNIRNCWFAQMVYGVRYHNAGQCIMMHDNCFADLETAIFCNAACMSTLHNNTFAYLSKCFVLQNASEVSITANAVKNWEKATGTAPCGAFLYAEACKNLNVSLNTVHHALDSRPKTITTDDAPNGRGFVHFKGCENTIFLGNILDTKQSEPVVTIEDCCTFHYCNNLVNYAKGGSAVAVKGCCKRVKTDE